MADRRLEKITGIARGLFITEGYAHTQIRDIAKAAGISVGAVYLFFTGKRAILDFVLQCALFPEHMDGAHAFPIAEDAFPSLSNDLMGVYYNKGIRFAEPLTLQDEGYTFGIMLEEAYEILFQHGACSLILEKNPHACGRAGAFYAQYKKRFYETFLRLTRLNIDNGSMREPQYPEYSARLMMETLCWWAMRAPFEDEELKEMLSAAERKDICLDALTHAFGNG